MGNFDNLFYAWRIGMELKVRLHQSTDVFCLESEVEEII